MRVLTALVEVTAAALRKSVRLDELLPPWPDDVKSSPIQELGCDWCGAYASRPVPSGDDKEPLPLCWVEVGEALYCSARCRHQASDAKGAP